jgi:hypothetical protein
VPQVTFRATLRVETPLTSITMCLPLTPSFSHIVSTMQER